MRLGLGGTGIDELNPELFQQPSELGRLAPAAELLFERELLFLGLYEDGVTVGIGSHRDAQPAHGFAHHLEVALGIFLLTEAGRGDSAGGVVDGAEQAENGSSALEPVVAAGVDLEEHPLPRVSIATAAVARRSPTTGRGHAGRLQVRCTLGRDYRREVDMDKTHWPVRSAALIATGVSAAILILKPNAPGRPRRRSRSRLGRSRRRGIAQLGVLGSGRRGSRLRGRAERRRYEGGRRTEGSECAKSQVANPHCDLSGKRTGHRLTERDAVDQVSLAHPAPLLDEVALRVPDSCDRASEPKTPQTAGSR